MSDFSAYKAVAIGLGAMFLVSTVAPEITGGRFDPLRLSKPRKPVKVGRTQICPDGTVISATSTCPTLTPTPTPTPTTTTTDPTTTTTDTTNGLYPEATIIPSNFDVDTTLTTAAVPAVNSSDVVGAFRFICGAGALMYDDPIVLPGQPGMSHLHQYYGNTAANADSTFSTLRASGDSTCNNMGNGTAANRSAYWMPALFDGKGYVVKPDYVQVYYKRSPDDAPGCYDSTGKKICISIPNGLRFISGFNMSAGTQSVQPGWFKCGNYQYYSNKEAMSLLNNTTCPAGSKLEITVSSLKCWNGQLDSSDHMKHLSGMISGVCPSTHPYLLPQFTISAFYTIQAGDDVSKWSLSSDAMHPDLPRGGTLHFDYFEAWDAGVKSLWMSGCIGKKLNCSAGNLGTGVALKGASQPTYGWLNPNPRVPIPQGGMSGGM